MPLTPRRAVKYLALLLAFMLLLTACGQTEEPATPESGTKDTTGGVPWLDTDLKENITADLTTSPQDDFHLYVNQDWLLQAELPAGYRSYNSFAEVELATISRTQELLEDQSLTGHNAELVQGLYAQWLDWESRNQAGMEPAKAILDKIAAVDSLASLESFMLNLEDSWVVPVFLALGTSADLDDASNYTVVIDHDSFLLSDAAEYQERTDLGNRHYEANKKAAVQLLSRVGYTQEQGEAMFDQVIALETELASVSMTSADMMAADHLQKINNKFTLAEISQKYPNFPVAKMIEAYGYGTSQDFIVYEPAYYEKLNQLYNEENLEKLKNYLMVKTILGLADFLDEEAYKVSVESSNTINGTSGQVEDREAAYRKVKGTLLEPLEQVYLDKYASEQMKSDITGICEQAIAYYRQMLQAETWLSEPTKAQAINKLDNIVIHAAYPEKWYDYSGLDLAKTSYFESLHQIFEFELERDQSYINQKVDPEEWNTDILTCNAFYDPQNNSINIMVGILDRPFYAEEMSEAELYGGIGVVIGHEISHAFDTNGAQFDEKGNLANWWTEEDLKVFQARAAKLAAFYDQIIPFNGQKIIGANIQTEVIADMAGVKAMLAMAAEKEGFDYDQFFRSYANIWKRINTYEMEEYCISQDPHPLHYLRTNVTLQQFDEFLETYHIQEGDKMYLAPEDRIPVW